MFVCIKVHIPNRCCFLPSLRWHSATFSHLLNFSSKFTNNFKRLQDHQSFMSSLFLLGLQNHVKFLSSSFFGFQSLARTNDSTGVYSNAHWFSLRTSSSSSCVKSFLMLNVLRISAGVFPLIIFATVWQHKSSNSLISK